LLGIDDERSHAFQTAIGTGCGGLKPGWVRVNLNYFLTDTVADYLIDAIDLLAADGWRLLEDYRFDPAGGLWVHRAGQVERPLRLTDVRYTLHGAMTYPRSGGGTPVSALPGYLAQARQIFAAAPADGGTLERTPRDRSGSCLDRSTADLQWFELPPGCLPTPSDRAELR